MKRIQCKCCGAPLTDRSSRQVVCPYCGTTFLLEESGLPVEPPRIPSPAVLPVLSEGWQCAVCEAMNPHGEEFCRQCGAFNSSEMQGGGSSQTGFWRCSNCGTVNDPEFPFCCNCGEMPLYNL